MASVDKLELRTGKGNERSCSDSGDAVRFIFSRTRAGAWSELRLRNGSTPGSETDVESEACRRLLVLLPLIELAEESSETGVRSEARRVSLVRVLKRFKEPVTRALSLTVLAIEGERDGGLIGVRGRSSIPSLSAVAGG